MNKRQLVALIACVATWGLALAEDNKEQSSNAVPQALSDAQLDDITAGGVTVIISNPGSGEVSKIDNPNRFICINCGGSSDKTNGVIITPSGKFIVIPGGPL